MQAMCPCATHVPVHEASSVGLETRGGIEAVPQPELSELGIPRCLLIRTAKTILGSREDFQFSVVGTESGTEEQYGKHSDGDGVWCLMSFGDSRIFTCVECRTDRWKNVGETCWNMQDVFRDLDTRGISVP